MANHNPKLNARVWLVFMLVALASCKSPTPPLDDDGSSDGAIVLNAGNPDWSPTGERFAFLRIVDSMICLYYFEDKRIEALVNGEEPSFSPDGNSLAYEWRRQIWTIDLITKSTKLIAAGVTPSWSESGHRIAFAPPTSFKRTSRGEPIPGAPNPDSSIYFYDLLGDSVGRIVVNNLNPPSGPEVGISYPTWVLKDSFLVFATEPQLVAVACQGGPWMGVNRLPSPFSTAFRKMSTDAISIKMKSEFLGAGRSDWNPILNELFYEFGENVFPDGSQCGLYLMVYALGWSSILYHPDATDLSWKSDSSRRVLFVKDNAIRTNKP